LLIGDQYIIQLVDQYIILLTNLCYISINILITQEYYNITEL